MLTTRNLKSNRINARRISEIFGNKKSKKRLGLCVFIDKKYKRLYHPLKGKKVNLKRLRFIEKSTETIISKFFDKDRLVSEKNVINWMLSMGVSVKKISSGRYIVQNRIINFANLLIMANKKRRTLKLEPFFVEGFSEE